jgi:uncharacterized protein
MNEPLPTLFQNIIDKYYNENVALRHILITHSQSVAQLALQIASLHPELHIDTDFVGTAAMLHDIGIVLTDAPGIECFGTEPYIRHGVCGAEILRKEGVDERFARVCERHTGAGLSLDDIVSQHLPLPHRSLVPETMEEKLICYADKFFSKTHLDRQKTVAQAEQSLAKFGGDTIARFREMRRLFE